MLYIVCTPIGNLEDISFRAIRILKEVDFIAAEDTRHTGKLLSHYDIKTKKVSFYEHNKVRRGSYLISELKKGKDIALVSDAGTPGISDPGYSIIRLAKENDIDITMIPGPCAAIMGLVLSNKPVNKFIFLGFLGPKEGRRQKQLQEIKKFSSSVILYESPHKLLKTLKSIFEVLGDIDVAICRELTKMFEEVKTKSVSEWISFYGENKPKGEFVLVL